MDFGGYYTAFIHSDVSYDLRAQTGAAAWRDPHTYSQPDEIWQGEIGAFEGFRFVETPTAPLFADAGSSTTLTDVYRTVFLGRQAFAKAYSHSDGNGAYPQFILGPVTDKLRRNVPVGWYWLGQYGVFRQASLRGVESASSIGAN
jgi:N4-gp56 family major capsid protein